MKLKRNSAITIVATIGLGITGCATLHNGTRETVTLESTPPGAEATVDGTQHLTTPAMVELERGKDHQILFHKEGYEDSTASLTSSESGWVWGNILIGGLPGIIADEIDGAAKKLSTDRVAQGLTPVATSSAATSPMATTQTQANTLIKPAMQSEPQDRAAQSGPGPQSQPAITTPPLKSE